MVMQNIWWDFKQARQPRDGLGACRGTGVPMCSNPQVATGALGRDREGQCTRGATMIWPSYGYSNVSAEWEQCLGLGQGASKARHRRKITLQIDRQNDLPAGVALVNLVMRNPENTEN